MHRYRLALTIVLFTLLALGASACAGAGGGGSGSRVASLNGSSSGGRGGATTTTAPDPQDAALAFARCMRQHGVDMPDPQTDSSGRTRLQLRGNPDKRKLQAAEAACGSLLKGGHGPGQPLSAAQQDAMLNFARCMRQHGIDMPDPTPGQAGVTLRKQTKAELNSPKFRRAEAACMHFIDQAFKPGRGGTR
jgi:hypothetical protein